MRSANLIRLIALAAIWGGTFLFMRIGAPVLGAAVLNEYRVEFGALFLASVARWCTIAGAAIVILIAFLFTGYRPHWFPLPGLPA